MEANLQKEVSSSPILEREKNAESCPVRMMIDNRHPYGKRYTDTATKFNLSEFEKADRETGGTMLHVIGMNRFYYLCNFHDMRCKYERVLSIIHQQLNREALEDEVFIVMSKLYLFSYLNNNRYDIDNSIAEHFIRSLTGERKDSRPFVSSRIANVSAAYHTLLSTCRMNAVSFGISEEILPRNCQREKGL